MENLRAPGSPEPQWMDEVETRMHMPPEEREALPLYDIIKEFKAYIEKTHHLDPQKLAKLAKRIKILASGRLHYYENSSMGPLVKEVSNLINIWNIGTYKSSGELGIELSQPYTQKKERLNKNLERDPKFICDETTYTTLLPKLNTLLKNNKEFNLSSFLAGPRGSSVDDLTANQQMLDLAMEFMKQRADALAKEKDISHEDAYKLLIGVLDRYDDEAIQIHNKQGGSNSLSTFVLRSAILLASVSEGIELQSWMVYTKSGKPDQKHLWTFLDNWQNWVPEAQGALAKFAEITFIKATELAKHSRKIKEQREESEEDSLKEVVIEDAAGNIDIIEVPPQKDDADQVIMLKGGFGAGKTRFAGKLPSVGEEYGEGVVAPDLGKRVVRRAMESIPHASAHIQGSQIAYQLFDEMIQRQVGDVVYDSSLTWPSDVQGYLEKSRKAGKRMVIFDIARNDIARALSVLKRSVGGDDPRIGPDFIIRSALNDKVNRTECMKVILNAEIKEGEESIAPEYRFVGADAKGWGTKEVMVIRPNSIKELDHEMRARLELEGIEIDDEAVTVLLAKSKDEFANYYKTQFERSVHDLLAEIETKDEDGKAEYKKLSEIFSGRSFDLASVKEKPIKDATSLYEALPKRIKKALPENALQEAFKAIGPDAHQIFFESIQNKDSFSYLDLPLVTALIINKNLQSDPWLPTQPQG